MKTLLFFCYSSGIQSGARFTSWGADQACGIYLQAVCLDNLTFFLSENAVIDLLFSPLFVFLTFLDVFTIVGFISRFCALSSINTHGWRGRRYGGIMIIYSRFRLFLSCFCAAGTDPGRSVRTVTKICSVLGALHNRPIWLLNGRLDSGWISISLFVLWSLWAKLERQLLTSGKSPAPVRRWSTAFYRAIIPVVKRTIFLLALEYSQYSDSERSRKTGTKMERLKNNFFSGFPFCLSCIY